MRSLVCLAWCLALAAGCRPYDSNDTPANDTRATVPLTGDEVWDQTIAYHDPQGTWADFAGAVRLVTAWADGTTRGLEYIEVDNAAGAYRATFRRSDVVTVKGIENGACYRSVNGNESPSDQEVEQYALSCEDAFEFQQHHGAHLGFPMIARQGGLKAEGPVTRELLRGSPVLAVPLVGDSATVQHPYWASRWTLYVDPDTYAVRGYRWENDAHPGQLWIVEGELDVNGIKMPQVKNVYRNEDGRLQFTDLFSHIGEWEALR